MVNEKSLENLRKPKAKKEGHGYQYALPQDKIDLLFSNMAEGMSLKKASKESDVCFPTARKYFHEGDVKRGIKPLKWRLMIFQERISEKFNVLIEERRIEMLSNVRTALSNINANVAPKDCPACAGTKVQEGKDGLKLLCPVCKGEGKIISDIMSKSTLKDMERLMRLEIFLLGGVTQKATEHKMMTAEGCSGDNKEG